ncbi:FAD binding domain-containing protein [Serratia fonticola]|uniref:FAD binding domain-containing protein n=1 Tax=Serratia fonticola TaxID=47917 RepID=UPI000E0E5C23|nr:FAD binding domain-containing protein [Serratia fonticola]RDL15142.1 carbon-monoxide dehydrogenase medium subunit [Serratia fonticola]
MKPIQFDYFSPESLEQALSAFSSHGGSKWLAGGQSLGPMLNLRLARPDALIQLTGLEALTQVKEAAQSITYGAMLRHAEFEDGKLPDITGNMLQHIASGIAYRAIRNRGTLGGSLAHADPAADWVNTMIVLDAQIHITGDKSHRSVAASEFMLAAFTTMLTANEIITAVQIPRLSESSRWGYAKFCRKAGELSEATGSVVVDPVRGYARIVLGALDGAPVLLEDLAEILAQQGIDAALAHADESVTPYVASMPEHRRKIYAVIVKKALMQIKGSHVHAN